MSIKKQPTVLITTPTLHGGKNLRDFLLSIQKLDYPKKRLTTMIVDNSFGIATHALKTKFPSVAFIKAKDLSFAKSVNLTLNQKKTDYIFIGNDDLILTPKSISQMITKLESDKTIGVLGGKIFFKDRSKTIASHGHDFNFFLGLVKDDPRSPDIEKEPLWVDACAMLIPRKTLRALEMMRNKFSLNSNKARGTNLLRLLGQTIAWWNYHQIQNGQSKPLATKQISVTGALKLFDETFSPFYFEDADLCLRIKKAGFRVVYDPTIIFYHGQSKSFSKLPTWKKYFYWYKNKTRFILKNFSFFLNR